jgi:hypothetical protein
MGWTGKKRGANLAAGAAEVCDQEAKRSARRHSSKFGIVKVVLTLGGSS